ncbi:site-specific DNA-methyltransferase [uncultured Coprobacter sp.]|uniref:DNA-methyltransferase n=1 Tax=uncultured Coprobacter sp. TaxID=1720550 RepID=UPI002633D8C5|nr:site-specific DNA-methyltransferase [uncultured Coprobacter sp.]
MEIEVNKVYNIDCLDLMREMKRQGVIADWLIADPPYGIGVGSLAYTKGVQMVGNALAKRRDYSSTGDWDSQRLTKEYFDLMFAVSKNQIIFGGNYYTDFLPPTKSWIVWDKRCDDKLRNDFADCELAWLSKGVARVFRYLYNGMLQGDMKNKDERFHPTQKPTQIICQLLNYYTKENDLILDPFMGSFTTAVACHRLNRRFIGAELDKEYFEKGSKRLDAEMAQLNMFNMIGGKIKNS